MKKHLLFTAGAFVLMGGGCTGEPADVTANDIETSAFLLPIGDESIIPEPRESGWRIQNFEGSDNPKTNYPDDAFFIEITSGGEKSVLEQAYGELSESSLGLGNKTVLVGEDGPVGGETWPNDVYFHEASGTVITVFAQEEEGIAAAKQLLEAIYWY